MTYERVEVNSKRWLDLTPLLNEEFRDIKDYEGLYQVSNYGRVKSLKIITKEIRHQQTKILKVSKNANGYYILNLSNKSARVHRLVAETFIDNPNNYPCVNHKDGIKTNNCVDNLEFCTHSYNNKEAYRLGLKTNGSKLGKDNKKSKHIIQYDLNYNKIADFYGTGDIKRKWGYSPMSILNCCKGKAQTAYNCLWRFANE